MRYTYSRWDGRQSSKTIDPDEVMEVLSDDLMDDGDLSHALERVVRWGLERDGEKHLPGLNHLLQQLRSQRQSELDRYNLDSILQDIKDRVAEVVQTERAGIERRRAEPSSDSGLNEILQSIGERKQSFLAALPEEPGSAVTSLSEYEFLDEGARERFGALTEMLERHVLQRHFQSMEQMLGGLSVHRLQNVKAMLHDLNGILRGATSGAPEGFDGFLRRYGDHFPGVRSFDELVDQMQEQASHTEALMTSMSPTMRRRLDSMMATILSDHALRDELGQVAEALESLAPRRGSHRDYPFSGDQSLTLEEALRLMRRMHDLDALEKDMRQAQETGDLQYLDKAEIHRVMGEAAEQSIEHLRELGKVLEQAGYVKRQGDSLELTARGMRKIGHKALQDIFHHLKRDGFGDHATTTRGIGGDRADETKSYEFGEPFLLDLHGTLMNAIERTEFGTPVRLALSDFEVFGTEQTTHAATVLMLDMSRSMPLRGCFTAAKKVVLALHSLIRLRYPQDHLYIVGFSDYARQLRAETLHQVSWGDHVYGTNMQHGLLLARRLLGKHMSSTRQVILITDGEPTAHFEGGRVHFAYPPTFRTFQETLREVKRCTHEGIVINTFMLERNHFLADFVTQMTKINKGRAFFATPEKLGDYIVVDYVRNRMARSA